jgi:MFS transporter, putative metabolite transport protein
MKTVQQYIDETPKWEDGTQVSGAPMTPMQWRIFGLATAGKFFEGLVVFMTGVALPLMVLEFSLNNIEKGMVGAASLFGILIGATALGGLADTVGRKQMFIIEMIIFTVFLAMVAVAPNFPVLVICLFGVGLALGCDYPTAHLVISESIPSNVRGRLVLSAFGFQAIGALAGTVLGFSILKFDGNIIDWRIMYAVAILPAIAVIIGRFFIVQSPHWLAVRGRIEEAEHAVEKLLLREPPYPKAVKISVRAEEKAEAKKTSNYGKLFEKKNRKAVVLASVPWFLQDLGTYGIGIFTPTILAATIGAKSDHPRNLSEIVHNDLLAAKGAGMIDVLLIVGIVVAILLADRVGRIKLQIWGFIGCAAGLLLAALSFHFQGPMQMVMIFAGFMLFNFMTNMGPNAMTYLLAGEVFPTKIRGSGAGFAASFAKIGAVMTAFLFPVLLHTIGTSTLLYILVGTSLLGALITWRFSIETKGLNLETLEN